MKRLVQLGPRVATAGAGGSGFGRNGFTTLSIVSDAISPDLADGRRIRVILVSATQITVNDPIWTGTAVASGDSFILYVEQDSTGGWPTPAFGSDFGADVTAAEIDGTFSTRTAYSFTRHPDGKWHLDSFTTGQVL